MHCKKKKLKRAEIQRVSVSVCHGGIGEYNKTYYRILIWRKLRGIWHCVLQVSHRLEHLWEYIRYSIMLLLSLPKGEKDVFVGCLCVFICFLGTERHAKPSYFYRKSCFIDADFPTSDPSGPYQDTSLELSVILPTVSFCKSWMWR